MIQISLISFSGPNHPSLMSAIMGVLSEYEINVLDSEMSVTHQQVNLAILIEATQAISDLVDPLELVARGLSLTMALRGVEPADYEAWVSQRGAPQHIVTLLARKISARDIAVVTEVAANAHLSIQKIERLSGRVSLQPNSGSAHECLEITVSGGVDNLDKLQREFLDLANHYDFDIAVQADDRYRKTRRLVCFDMDSTLIQVEVIDELAKAAGVGDQVAEVTERAMRGELDFNESFASRLATLKGLDESVLQAIAANLPITDGAERLISTLKSMGYKTAILSGGFTYFAQYLQQKLGIDYVYANELAVHNGQVTGQVQGDVVNGERKAQLLRELAEREGLTSAQVIAVGDGANDIPMLSAAGLGIAFHAKPLVKSQAQHAISNLGLDAILYLVGYRDAYSG